MINTLLSFIKKSCRACGVDTRRLAMGFNAWSIRMASTEHKFDDLIETLRKIEPDISKQYSYEEDFNNYWELKMRTQHAFQVSLMLKALECSSSGKLTVVDIGDSAGTHMRYLRKLVKDKCEIDCISVNLDSKAVEKIKSMGQKALLCRAEELDLGDAKIDLFTSFEMLEHLHNPAAFFRRLAKRATHEKLVITVPYMRQSRVGLYHVRNKSAEDVFAESEHVFELSPEDWTLLMKHSGWKVLYSRIYYQYPRRLPLLRHIFRPYWRQTDFEGFWGAILEKDTTFSNHYKDWEE